MYTYKKRIAAIALAALMGLSCIGCGKNDESSQPTAVQSQTTAEVTTAAAATQAETVTAKETTVEETTAETTTQTTTSAKKKTATAKKKTQTTTSAATTATAVATAAPIVTNPPMPVVQAAATVTKAPQKPTSSSTLDSVVKNYPYNSSVILYCMDGKTLYSNDPNRVYYGASMIKLPYVYYCCTQLEKGVHSLDETVTYTADQYMGGSGVIIYRGVGQTYTIEQLIDYSLRYSDNVAHCMLVRLFGIEGFNQMMADWGYDSVDLYSYSYFTDLTPDFILTAMKKMQAMSTNKGRAWQAAWKALIGSEGLRIKNYFSNEAVAGKYGLYSGVYHEACYFGGKEPYILVVMTQTIGYSVNNKYMEDVAAAARAEVNKYTAEKEAAAKAEAEKTATKATTAKPKVTKPKVTKPETTEPKPTKPETTKPKTSKGTASKTTTTTRATSSATTETTATTPETTLSEATPTETTVSEETPQVTTPPETTPEAVETSETAETTFTDEN